MSSAAPAGLRLTCSGGFPYFPFEAWIIDAARSERTPSWSGSAQTLPAGSTEEIRLDVCSETLWVDAFHSVALISGRRRFRSPPAAAAASTPPFLP